MYYNLSYESLVDIIAGSYVSCLFCFRTKLMPFVSFAEFSFTMLCTIQASHLEYSVSSIKSPCLFDIDQKLHGS